MKPGIRPAMALLETSFGSLCAGEDTREWLLLSTADLPYLLLRSQRRTEPLLEATARNEPAT